MNMFPSYPADVLHSEFLNLYVASEKELALFAIDLNKKACKELMIEYFCNKSIYDCYNIFFSYPKSAVKSYGNERRFFNPPPQIQILKNPLISENDQNSNNIYHGDSYITMQVCGFNEDKLNSATIDILANNEILSFFGSSYTTNNCNTETRPKSRKKFPKLRFPFKKKKDDKNIKNQSTEVLFKYKIIEEGFSLACNTHISESIYDKYITLRSEIKLNGYSIPLGTIESFPIKVISKPVKKKTRSIKQDEANITNASLVAFSHRIRSQNVACKYMLWDKNSLICDTEKYSVFYILLYNKDKNCYQNFGNTDDRYKSNKPKSETIKYNSLVKLANENKTIITGSMYIRKVENEKVIFGNLDSCLSMNRIAFESVELPNHFLSYVNGKITFVNHSIKAKNYRPEQYEVMKSCCIWTIINMDKLDYNFSIKRTNCEQSSLIAVFRSVDFFQVIGGTFTFEAYGDGFMNDFQMFIGLFPLDTYLKCAGVLLGTIRNLEEFQLSLKKSYNFGNGNTMIKVPFLVVSKSQEIIYDTKHLCVISLTTVGIHMDIIVAQ